MVNRFAVAGVQYGVIGPRDFPENCVVFIVVDVVLLVCELNLCPVSVDYDVFWHCMLRWGVMVCGLGSFFRVGRACVRSVGSFPIVVFFRFRGFFGLFLVVGRRRRFW